MKIMIVSVLSLASCVANAVTNEDAVISGVRTSVAAVVASMPSGLWGQPAQIREFGMNPRGFSGYQALVDVVSSNQDVVCSNFNFCATNEISRMMLLSAWWGGDDALFISGLSRCLDMAMAGTLPREDLTWYRFGHGIERRNAILSLRYDEPGISNLVIRLCNYTGETNACRRILSGASRRSISDYLDQNDL